MQSLKYQNMWNIFKDHSFEFTSLPTTLKCIVCNEILKNPKQTTCGCRCCKECLNIHLTNDNCEDCQGISELNFPDDSFANREISELTVKCPFHLCTFKSMFKNMIDHIECCRFKICPREVIHQDIIDESSLECPDVLSVCEYCDLEFNLETIPSNHYDINSVELCSEYKAVCPYKCEMSDEVILKNHIRVCSNRPLICPYFEMGGCSDTNIFSSQMNEHLCRSGFQHTRVLLEMITNLGNEIKTTKQQLLAKSLEINKYQQKLLELEETLAKVKLNEIPDPCHEPSGAQINSSNELINIQTMLNEHDTKLFSILKKIDLFDVKFDRKTTEYIWRVENFTKVVNDAYHNNEKRLVYSKPFFIARNGHRARLVFEPFGSDNGNISLSFQLMKSRLDSVLCWPFQYDVSLALLEQSDSGRVHKLFHLFYDPTDEEQARVYCRPTGPTEHSDLYGVRNFLKLKSIQTSPNLLQDDSIFFRFTCKPTCLCE